MAHVPSVVLLSIMLLVSSLLVVVPPAVAEEHYTSLVYSGSLSLSATVSGYDPDFYESFSHSASATVPLEITLEKVGRELKGRYPISGVTTISYSSEYSIVFRGVGCSLTGSSQASGSHDGTITYHLFGIYDASQKVVNINFVYEGDDNFSTDNCGGGKSSPAHLLFGLDGTGAMGTIGGTFYTLTFPLGGGQNSYSGPLEYWQSSTMNASYEGRASLTLVSATVAEPTTTTTTATTTTTTTRATTQATTETTTGITTATTSEFTATEECLLTLTPKLPGIEGESIGKNDRTSYRLSLQWRGDVPASGLRIRYAVSELSGLNLAFMGISAEFSFNPVTIYQSSTSHLLNIETKGAAEGTYALIVVATVDDPGWRGAPCSSGASVSLIVAKDFVTRLTFPTLGSVSSIQGNLDIIKGESGEKSEASTGSEINVGDTLVTGSDSDTIIGIESKGGLVQLWKDTATTFIGIERRAASDGTEVVLTVLPRAIACQGLSDSALVRCDLFYEFLAEQGIPERLAPKVIGTAVLLSLWRGIMYFHSGDWYGQLPIDWILTRTVAIAPRGTEFTVEVASDGRTTVSIFEGFVEVVDLVSGHSVLLGSNEQLVLPAVAGLSEEEMSSLTTTFDPNTVARWWDPQSVIQAQVLSVVLLIAAAVVVVTIGAIVLKRRPRRIGVRQQNQHPARLSQHPAPRGNVRSNPGPDGTRDPE